MHFSVRAGAEFWAAKALHAMDLRFYFQKLLHLDLLSLLLNYGCQKLDSTSSRCQEQI